MTTMNARMIAPTAAGRLRAKSESVAFAAARRGADPG
jgi:hypothetical protein